MGSLTIFSFGIKENSSIVSSNQHLETSQGELIDRRANQNLGVSQYYAAFSQIYSLPILMGLGQNKKFRFKNKDGGIMRSYI